VGSIPNFGRTRAEIADNTTCCTNSHRAERDYVHLRHDAAHMPHARLASEKPPYLLHTCYTGHYFHSKHNSWGRKGRFHRSRTRAVRETACFYSQSAGQPPDSQRRANVRSKGGLRLRTRRRGRSRRERRGFRNEYRGINGLRQLRGNARRFGLRPCRIVVRPVQFPQTREDKRLTSMQEVGLLDASVCQESVERE
jgi:hypothetical protein